MRVLILLIFLSVSVVVVTTALKIRQRERLWHIYKVRFGKNYDSQENEKERKEIFAQNVRDVKEHNKAFAKGLVTYKKGINHLSDRTNEQVVQESTGLKIGPIPRENIAPTITMSTTNIPDNYNVCIAPNFTWPIRNQENCGSCWAFSTIGSLEYCYYRKYGVLLDLAEKQLVDCVYPRSGCTGGWMPDAYKYLASCGGSINTTQYPYVASYGTCQASQFPKMVQLMSGTSYYNVNPYDNLSLQQAVLTYGALASVADASDWGSYVSGIYANWTRTFKPNHAVVLCGWGTASNGGLYWIIRNSWDPNWGQSGHIYVNATSKSSSVTYGGFFPAWVFFPNCQ